MINTEHIKLIEETPEVLFNQGYTLMSYDGESCLKECDRTRKNTCDGELSLSGAEIFAENVFSNAIGVGEVRIVRTGNGGYDVYAKMQEKAA